MKSKFFIPTLAISLISVTLFSGLILFGIWLIFGQAGDIAQNTSDFIVSIPFRYAVLISATSLIGVYLKKKKFD